MALAELRLYTHLEFIWVEQQKQWHLSVCRNSTLNFLVLLCTLRSHQCYSTRSWFLPNLHWSPQVLIGPSKCCFRVHSKTDKSHLLQSRAQDQKTHSTLLSTWDSRTLSSLWLKVCASNISMAKLKTSCLPFFMSESTRNNLNVSKSSSDLSTSIGSTNFH